MFDCCVVGAGPAGSMAAYHLAHQGFKVALIDKSVFPRDKACGDMVGPEALRVLKQIGLSPLLDSFLHQQDINEIWELQFNGGTYIKERIERLYENDQLRWAIIPRLKLDAALLEQAQKAGAVIFQNAVVQNIDYERTQASITVGGISNRLQARLVMIATGSKSKFVPYSNRTPHGFAVRNYYDGPSGLPLTLYFAADLQPGGYEWIFPVSSTRYNAGVFTTNANMKSRHMRLDKRLRDSRLVEGLQPAGKMKGGWLNYNFAFSRIPVHAERMLWVGDAAGIVQPHHGEGISQAFLSSELAAEVAATALEKDLLGIDDLSIYTRRLRQRLSGVLRSGRIIYEVMKYPRVMEFSFSALLAGYRFVRDGREA